MLWLGRERYGLFVCAVYSDNSTILSITGTEQPSARNVWHCSQHPGRALVIIMVGKTCALSLTSVCRRLEWSTSSLPNHTRIRRKHLTIFFNLKVIQLRKPTWIKFSILLNLFQDPLLICLKSAQLLFSNDSWNLNFKTTICSTSDN